MAGIIVLFELDRAQAENPEADESAVLRVHAALNERDRLCTDCHHGEIARHISWSRPHGWPQRVTTPSLAGTTFEAQYGRWKRD